MRAESRQSIESWWSGLFGIEGEQLWREVTVLQPHGRLRDYAGWYVAWRESGVHVSAPSSATAAEVASLRDAGAGELQDGAFWEAFAHQRGLEVRGPARHAYLDADPGPDPDVRPATDTDLAALRAAVRPEEWEESGWADAPPERLVLEEDGVVVAAANLNRLDDTARDIGVLVAPAHRGRGLSERVGRHAASWAVTHVGLARWSAREANAASLRAAERLGFEHYATQLGLRPTA